MVLALPSTPASPTAEPWGVRGDVHPQPHSTGVLTGFPGKPIPGEPGFPGGPGSPASPSGPTRPGSPWMEAGVSVPALLLGAPIP